MRKMASAGNYGTTLLTFNTNREPDPDRGEGIKHFELSLPIPIMHQIGEWEKGDRAELRPREAAEMLWETPTALHLDGRFEAWKDVPGVGLLLPGWRLIAASDQESLPENIEELQNQFAAAGDPGMSRDAFMTGLKSPAEGLRGGDMSTADFLNDLLLIFKYAAVGYQRPVSLVADLFRLARTLLADESDAPSSRKEMFGWLTAPLIVPRVFTAPLGPTGPRAPSRPDENGNPSKPPGPIILFEKDSPQHLDLIRWIERDLDEIDRMNAEKTAIRDIRDRASAEERKVIENIVDAGGGNTARPLSTNRGRIIRRVTSEPARRPSGVVTANIGGFPVRIDITEVNRRADLNRREMTRMLFSTLPEGLKARIDALDNADYVMEWAGELNDTLPYHPPPPAAPSYLEPVGRTDLLLVRQATIGYRRAEIAHVENVLIGETRQRDHTKRILTRDELFESTERESEETSDLQTTDSSKLSNEVSEVVSEDLRAEGSVEITYRGPTKVVANAAGSFEKSTENTANAATEYASEIVERAATRMFERITRESRSLFEQEIIVENRHHFTRGDDETEHVSGIYQYLERVSRAKIFSYGERDLYDVLVPEPAALIWNMAIPPIETLDIPIDEPDHELFNSLTFDNIGDHVEQIIRAFKVVDFPPTPKETHTEPFAVSGMGSGHSGKLSRSGAVRIPDGYVAVSADYSISVEYEGGDDKPNGGIVVGGLAQTFDGDSIGLSGNKGVAEGTFGADIMPPQQSAIAVAVNAENFQTLAGAVQVHMQLTEEKRREWAIESYGRVAQRYEEMRRDYEQAELRAEATQPDEEVDLPVGARRRLNKIVRTELQRAAIGIMRNAPVNFDLIHGVAKQGPPYPTTDIPALKAAEPEIRFLQQAFEWEHLSWVLYPYFWGARGTWQKSAVQDHPDPDFAAFLNAGAARLQISVRPGFQDLVKHFMETGRIGARGEKCWHRGGPFSIAC